ncbi:HNH endonuclease [Paenibacillus sp. TRM 82003]|nr:HNH endonuclease [Paenibacillus sp. TRM 82003]
MQSTEQEPSALKICAECGEPKPVTDFVRRTGRKARKGARRGACRDCRKARALVAKDEPAVSSPRSVPVQAPTPMPSIPQMPQIPPTPAKPRRTLKPLPPPLLMPEGLDLSLLRPTKDGVVRMRGKTDKGRRWVQETDLETAVVLVKEFAAVVVNRHTIRRLYSNKAFRHYVLSRDRYKCYFCGEPADTIDHLLPRAKGGHTTPVNCVAACALCNQMKADRDVEDFLDSRHPSI